MLKLKWPPADASVDAGALLPARLQTFDELLARCAKLVRKVGVEILAIDDELLTEAQKVGGHRTKKDTAVKTVLRVWRMGRQTLRHNERHWRGMGRVFRVWGVSEGPIIQWYLELY